MVINMFNNIYKNKRVLITGHTGFKGSWLSTWLLKLGAEVIGVSNEIPTSPSLFETLGLAEKITDYRCDIRDLINFKLIIEKEKPDFIFHLAAQPIVSISYHDPLNTISSNVIGTANLLEIMKEAAFECVMILITSDKAYDNVEQVWGYKENDSLGGKDVYSGSKGAAELIIKSYFNSFYKNSNNRVRLGVGRAGNVIGGGDWARDRIVVDCMQSWSGKKRVEIRSPNSTRPWQHVLEPLSGYLSLGVHIYNNPSDSGECFNFGPRAEQNRTAVELLTDLSVYWEFNNKEEAYASTDYIPFNESSLLKLNCDKALSVLNWQSCLSYDETVRFTSLWYFSYYNKSHDMYNYTLEQLNEFENLAFKQNLKWTI